MKTIIREGDYAKLGVALQQEWTVFTFCGEKEDQCAVVLVEKNGDAVRRIEVPEEYCLGSLRSVAVKNLTVEDYVYYFEINGKRVMDPYAHGIMGRYQWNDLSRKKNRYEVYGEFIPDTFDWGKDRAPEVKRAQMVMYKLHVRGFTMDSGTKSTPGTFRALINRIPYLKKLGITTVELMPVYEFEEFELPKEPKKLPKYIQWREENTDIIKPPKKQEQKIPKLNYWGYKKGEYFAVKASYAQEPQKASQEYKTLVKKLHENRLECVMEMYFPEDTNHNLVLEVLRYWVLEYHVDGFHLLGTNLPVTAIVQDAFLSRTKIFYTGFDENSINKKRKYKNLYIYKDEYMYPVRRMLNHQNGNMRDFVDQQRKQGYHWGYVNFIASNNGFTLADLFMYNEKHNEANGENNQDGSIWNFSSNYGAEGPTRKKYIGTIRRMKWRNSMVMLFLAQGVPLVWAGDEMCNSQQGNNNAYCQDNPTGWLNWKNESTHRREIRFFRQMLEFRKKHPAVANEQPFQYADYRSLGFPDLSFHGENAWISDSFHGRQCLGMMYCGGYAYNEKEIKSIKNAEDVYVAYNFMFSMSALALPKLPRGRHWYLVIDTANDKTPFLEAPLLCEKDRVNIRPQAICVLVSKRAPQEEKPVKRKQVKE